MNLKIVAALSALATAIIFSGALPAEAARAVVTGNTNLRSGPSNDHRIIGRLRNGDIVNVTHCARSHRWCHVEPRRVRSGWVSSRFLDRISGSSRGRPSSICFYGSRGRICLNR